MPSYWQNIQSKIERWGRALNEAYDTLEGLVNAQARELRDMREDVSRNNKNWIDATSEQRDIKSEFNRIRLELERLERAVEQRDNRIATLEAWRINTESEPVDIEDA